MPGRSLALALNDSDASKALAAARPPRPRYARPAEALPSGGVFLCRDAMYRHAMTALKWAVTALITPRPC